jgi:phosphoribosylformylglycinamidine synthase
LNIENTATLFGEDQARYLVACNFDQAEALMIAASQANIPIASIGQFLGKNVKFGNLAAPLVELRRLYIESFDEMVI